MYAAYHSAEAERSFVSSEETEDFSKVYHGRGALCTPISYRHALQRPGLCSSLCIMQLDSVSFDDLRSL